MLRKTIPGRASKKNGNRPARAFSSKPVERQMHFEVAPQPMSELRRGADWIPLSPIRNLRPQFDGSAEGRTMNPYQTGGQGANVSVLCARFVHPRLSSLCFKRRLPRSAAPSGWIRRPTARRLRTAGLRLVDCLSLFLLFFFLLLSFLF